MSKEGARGGEGGKQEAYADLEAKRRQLQRQETIEKLKESTIYLNVIHYYC